MKFTYKNEEYEVALRMIRMDGKVVTAAEIAKDKKIHGPIIEEALAKYGEANFHKNGIVKFYVPGPEGEEDAEKAALMEEIETLKRKYEAILEENEALKDEIEELKKGEEEEEKKGKKK